MYHIRERFDIDLLDPDDPFEVDDVNRPHLYKHAFTRPDGAQIRIELRDVWDLWAWNAVLLYPADESKGVAHWLLVGDVDGVVVVVPLAPPTSGDPTKCRPIAIFPASKAMQDAYQEDVYSGEK
jgi:hypothetical protein